MCQHQSAMGNAVDHLIICVDDLDRGSSLLESRYGLASIPGGRHGGHGTANHLVPLGHSYLEVVAVVDVEEASRSSFGRWVGEKARNDIALHGLCLRTDDIEVVSKSRGLEVTAMSRRRPDGVELRWRVAALSHMLREGLPFFIQWDIPEALHPGRGPNAPHGTSIEVHLRGQVEKLTSWVGDADGLSVSPGAPAVDRLLIHTPGGTIEI